MAKGNTTTNPDPKARKDSLGVRDRAAAKDPLAGGAAKP